ncbi:Acyl transferase domain-containing protein [Actinopolyspora alba]|uniref:Acyl transferase domain-containing protein n=1 Tax=Actinopolyspora alba TaxID=673379 RepID=A0A1I1VNZ2_9ACTN|nr:type I polyketide synthase [Actinopolyspora alba]SFD84812.1 Acyl transferase domain-containing protein [Actinopolyspora alba]
MDGYTKSREDVAIVGMACRFPGADSVDDYWGILTRGVDAVTEIPTSRFDIDSYYDPTPATPGRTVSRSGGFLSGIDEFDAEFFRISPREAREMDPQQRLVLHGVWEALEDAGIRPSELAGTRTGVIVGQATAEYASLSEHRENLHVHRAAGSVLRTVTAGRVSHALDLRGPSLVVDTACSSSLVAVHQGCESLRSGDSDLVLAVGVNLVLSPNDAISYSQGDMLSADGRCKFGDAKADGFVRSDGIGVVVLQRRQDALRQGNPIRASVLGSTINNDGNSSGLLLKPAVTGQRDLVSTACRQAGVHPAELDYVEAHGSGTGTGDAVELEALAQLAGEHDRTGAPLPVGSVKSNIGHTEAAAGIAGLIKATLILERGTIPASLHMSTPNRTLRENPAVQVVTTPKELTATTGRGVVGVSSFGISGTNAHVVLGAEPAPSRSAPAVTDTAEPHVLVLSARSRSALLRTAAQYADYLSTDGPGTQHPLRDICHTAATRREAHPHRLWVTGFTHGELAERLRDLVEGTETQHGGVHRVSAGTAPSSVFVFPGQGGQWSGMGRRLLEVSPTFREALVECDRALHPELGWSVLDTLTEPTVAEHNTAVEIVQPLLWSMQVSLARLLRSHGIEPKLCIGHSMGEVAAAHIAGWLSLSTAAQVIARRSRLMKRLSGRGLMLATDLTPVEAHTLLTSQSEVCVAAENGANNTVLSGEADAIHRIADRLNAQGKWCREINVDVASHSPLTDELRDDLLDQLAGIGVSDSGHRIPMLSTVHGRPVTDEDLDTQYWADNLRLPVRFAESIDRAAREGSEVFLEISPHPVLLPAIAEITSDISDGASVVAAQNRNTAEDLAIAKTLGHVFCLGLDVKWEHWYRAQARHVRLPTYAWDREKFWLDDAKPVVNSEATRANSTHFTLEQLGVTELCRGLGQGGITVLPAAASLEAVYAAVQRTVTTPMHHAAAIPVLEGIQLSEVTVETAGLAEARLEVRIDVTAHTAEAPFSVQLHGDIDGVTGSGTQCMTGWVRLDRNRPAPTSKSGEKTLTTALARCRDYVSGEQIHSSAVERGIRLPRDSSAHGWRADGNAVLWLHPPVESPGNVLEALLQPLLIAHPGSTDDTAVPTGYVPTSFHEITWYAHPGENVWSIARITEPDSPSPSRADVTVLAPDGSLIAEFRGITLLKPPRSQSGKGTELVGHPTTTERAGPDTDHEHHHGRTAPTVDRNTVLTEIAAALGTSPRHIDQHKTLIELGLDSLMALQLQRRLAAVGISTTARSLLQSADIRRLIAEIIPEHAPEEEFSNQPNATSIKEYIALDEGSANGEPTSEALIHARPV